MMNTIERCESSEVVYGEISERESQVERFAWCLGMCLLSTGSDCQSFMAASSSRRDDRAKPHQEACETQKDGTG